MKTCLISTSDDDPFPEESISPLLNLSPSEITSYNNYRTILAYFPVEKKEWPFNSCAKKFRDCFFPMVSDSQWNDYRWQLSHSINAENLMDFFVLNADEKQALVHSQKKLPLKITPYFASLIDAKNPNDPLRKCVIPTFSEFLATPEESGDPLSEDKHSPVEGIVHRYPDRVLFLATDFCSVNCRYCTRSRVVGQHGCRRYRLNNESWLKGIEYIQMHKEIRDVLISGGDPFTLPETKLQWLLQQLRNIPHVEIIRIGTKVPVVLPQKITKSLVNMLKKFHPLWVSIHFTHPTEITPECSEALRRLADAGIPLGSQTVLLKGVNDSVKVMKSLMHKLMLNRVRPYYIYQCDPITGSRHFRTSVEKGLEIIEGLRGHTSGYAVPQYVIDAPGGGGKIPLLPDYFQGMENGKIKLRNYEGKTYFYPNQH